MLVTDLARETLFQLRAGGVLDVGGQHMRALGHEQLHRPQADAGTGAGDDRDLAFQASHFSSH